MSEWYEKAKSGWDTTFEKPTRANEGSNNRFWMPAGTEQNVLFLSEQPGLVIFEHQVKLGSSYRNFATCLSMVGQPCPLCDLGVTRSQIGVFTIVDCSTWKDKEGKEHSDVKRLFVAKNRTWEKLVRQHKRRMEAGQSLRGALYLVARGSDPKSPSVGDEFEFQSMVDLAEIADSTEFDYVEIFKPNPELVKRYATQYAASQGLASPGAETSTPSVKY